MANVVIVTGNIGAGKSTVAKILADNGAYRIDADKIAKEEAEPGHQTYQAIVDTFGENILTATKTIDRQKLGNIVFADEKKRAQLEAITHPAILARVADAIATAQQEQPVLIVVEIPLFFELNLDKKFPLSVLVTASNEVRQARLKSRDQLTSEEVALRMRAQMPQEEKCQRATWIIDNSGTYTDLISQIKTLWPQLIG